MKYLLLLVLLFPLGAGATNWDWGQGEQGPQGEQGEQGEQGPAGPKGMKGNQGDSGNPGTAGMDGIAGAAGTNGLDGSAGIQGSPGKDYLDSNSMSDDDISELFAGATAMAGLDFDSTTTKTQVGIAVGFYDGEDSMAIGIGKVWDSDQMGDILFSVKTTVDELNGHRPVVGAAIWKF
jgi:hypothetical protein